jgi:plastocyanin
VDGLRQEANACFTQEAQPGGTTLWTVPVGALTNSPTGPLELLEYFPSDVEIKAGDTVRWTAKTPHSVTLLSGQELPTGEPTRIPPARPPDKYDGQSLYHSGIFALGPQAPAEFELTFPEAGTFPYICVLHVPLGHRGTITVQSG